MNSRQWIAEQRRKTEANRVRRKGEKMRPSPSMRMALVALMEGPLPVSGSTVRGAHVMLSSALALERRGWASIDHQVHPRVVTITTAGHLALQDRQPSARRR